MKIPTFQTNRVQFIHLDAPDIKRKDQIICALAADYYKQEQTVLIRTDFGHIQLLDMALWKCPAAGFLPHAILPCDTTIHSVLLAPQDCEIEGIDVVIVGTTHCDIQWLGQFPHVVEFAEVHSEKLRSHSRHRFKHWRSLGLVPEYQKDFQLPEGFELD